MMLETRSAVYKMLQTTAPEDRQVDKWPPPFSSDCTPYAECDFHALVKRSCVGENVSLRMAKVIIIGDVAVGKTSLVNRFCHKRFDSNYKATIGVDFEVERFDVLGVPFNLQIWDTAGQERFKCIAASYYRNANVIMVTFDLGNLMSLGHCQQWLIEANKSNPVPCQIFLVGTKKDTLSNRVYDIIEKRAVEVARRMRAEYWAVSSKTGDGVLQLFTRVAAISFNATMMKELQNLKLEPVNIGPILVKRQSKEVVTKQQKKSGCTNCMY